MLPLQPRRWNVPSSQPPWFARQVGFCVLVTLLCGCGGRGDDTLVTAKTVAGARQGVLEGVTVASKEALAHKEQRTIVDVDVLHTLEVVEAGLLDVNLSSEIVPPIKATVLGAGPVALNLKVVDVGQPAPGQSRQLKNVEVDQLVFVKHDGEWVLALQLSKMGLVPDSGSTVNAYQYVSYPSSVAQQMSRDEAVAYVDLILDLASQAQRN